VPDVPGELVDEEGTGLISGMPRLTRMAGESYDNSASQLSSEAHGFCRTQYAPLFSFDCDF
jgi:hypothetical protein